MNAPIRRLAVLVGLLFASLLISTTLIQYVFAGQLNARPDNRRTLLSVYNRDRGPILVGTKEVATSVRTEGEFTYLRRYPEKSAYAHVTGYFSFFGAAGGLELAENSLLAGSSDKLFYRRASDLITGRKPQGATLKLTLNPAAQQAAIAALGTQRGAAVALDPRTGAILAMVSNPTYDPNVLSSHDLTKVDAAYKRLNADSTRPLVNRAIGGNLYPPGSTFKLITAAAALSSGSYAPDSALPGPARMELPQTTVGLSNATGRPCGSTPQVTMAFALQQSCNTPFAYLGMKVGADAVGAQAAKFGFGDTLSIPMRVTPSRFPADLNQPQLAQSSIGGYDVRVTPLQMALVAGAIGNGGIVMRPYLVESVLGSDLSTIEEASPERLSQAISAQVAAQLTGMMRGAVENGTGRNATIPGIAVAGKTGTARHAEGKAPHAWFVGFAPANNPTIAVAVVVEDGGDAGREAAGGTVAAPIARDIIEAVLKK